MRGVLLKKEEVKSLFFFSKMFCKGLRRLEREQRRNRRAGLDIWKIFFSICPIIPPERGVRRRIGHMEFFSLRMSKIFALEEEKSKKMDMGATLLSICPKTACLPRTKIDMWEENGHKNLLIFHMSNSYVSQETPFKKAR